MALPTPTLQLQLQVQSSSLQKPSHHNHNHNHNHIPNIPNQLKEKILSLEIMGVDAGKALAQNPSLLTATLASLNSVVTFLRTKANLRPEDLPKVVGMCPSILTSDVTLELSPSLRFLSSELRVPDHRLRRVLTKNPRLLASSAQDQLRPALFFLQRLGFSDLNSLAHNDSVLLVSNVERTLIPKLRFLEESLGLTRPEAAAMVLRCPSLFTFSVENNFKPKLEFFAGEMGRHTAELKEFPQYFAFSLEKRIKPRHAEVAKRGLANRIPLPLMLKTTDDEFWDLLNNTTNTSIRGVSSTST